MTPEQLKASILQYAIQGKLVEQRPEEGTGEELYQQIQEEKQRQIKEGKIKKEKSLPEIKDDEIPFEIPESWMWVRMGDCTGYGQPKLKISPKDIHGKMWSLDLEDIQKETGKIFSKTMASDKKINGDKVVFNKGQVLYSKLRPSLKKILVAPDDGICTPELVPFDTYLVDENYIVYVLRSPHIDYAINSVTYGVKMPRVGTDTMVNLLIPIPPLAEQKRIAAKIEELLPYVDRYAIAYEKLDLLNAKFPEQIKKSILQYAIQGKLVEQRPEEGTGEELYQQIQEEKQRLIQEGKIKKEKPLLEIKEEEIPFNIPESWKWVKLGNVGSWSAGATPPRNNPAYFGGSIPWLKTGDLNDGYIREVPEYITDLAMEKTSIRINPMGSVLMAMYGATIGKLGILEIQATTNQACCACIPTTGMDNKYLFYYLMSIRSVYIKMAEGGAQPNISKEKIVNSLIPLPPLVEQKRIVAKIEELFLYYNRLPK